MCHEVLRNTLARSRTLYSDHYWICIRAFLSRAANRVRSFGQAEYFWRSTFSIFVGSPAAGTTAAWGRSVINLQRQGSIQLFSVVESFLQKDIQAYRFYLQFA